MRFDRFMRLIGTCLLTGCAIDSMSELASTPEEDLREITNVFSPGEIHKTPCNTEIKLITTTGMVVTIYLNCAQEQKKSPQSDDSSWGNTSQNEDVTSFPGWIRPPSPGDPRPQ